jgi:hypothetical protein
MMNSFARGRGTLLSRSGSKHNRLATGTGEEQRFERARVKRTPDRDADIL